MAGYNTRVSDPSAQAPGPATESSESATELARADTQANTPLRTHIALFVITCATTVWAGALSFGTWSAGISFGATLMTILLCHEMGHYILARRHQIDVSLPYFIPLPPQISLGTLGAVIRMRESIADRNQLIDVGAAGPLAGLAAALPLLIVGLSMSDVEPTQPGAYLEGNSLLYLALKYAIFGQYLPGADGLDVVLHPIAFAAWVGLLITMINLIPIGQLDGGHIACGLLGARHEETSRWLHRGLVAVAACVVVGLYAEAHSAGLAPTDALSHGVMGAAPWLVWGGLLWFLRRRSGERYHPPVGDAPLTAGRRRLVWFMLALFLSLLTPVPFRPVL